MLHVVHLMAQAKMAGLFRAVGLDSLDHSSPQIDDDTQTCRCLGDGAQETDKERVDRERRRRSMLERRRP